MKSGKFILGTLFLAAMVPFIHGCGRSTDASVKVVEKKNIIFMVPDGMGLSGVTSARIYKKGMNGGSLNFESLPYIGYQQTHSRNSTVTDSAAAASAWASGEKFNNGEISCLDEDKDGVCDDTRVNKKTILELAKDQGFATGLVATSDITHATPAVWGAHVHSRKCESEIFKQYLDNEIDVLLGGGIATNRSSCQLTGTDDTYTETLIDRAIDEGYTHTTTKTEMKNAAATASKLLGVYNDGGLSPVYTRSAASTEPTLKEMTEAALSVLEKDNEGFFLMVEGSQIDWANHANDVKYQIMETLDFDDSVKVVRDWIDADEKRKNNTLLIVVPDHDTAGFAVNGPYGSLAESGDTTEQYSYQSYNDAYGNGGGAPVDVVNEDGDQVLAPFVEPGWTSGGHTAQDVLIWSNSPECAKSMDNTELFGVMETFIKGI